MPSPRTLRIASVAGALLAATATAQEPPSVEATRGLYLEHCARCHGETGDGRGSDTLDRPARSFLEGGFSYGNTPEAVVRSITHGIPGTPMPGFRDALTEEQREALAAFVISLGPEGTVVEPGASVLRVADRPMVVRGMLPPLADGLPTHPRGLLIGFPNGMTFEYRADDVRLLAVRQGDFVDRKDWGGRGGRPLEPLGKVVQALDGGDPGPTWLRRVWRAGADGTSRPAGTEPLAAELRSTRVVADGVHLDYALVDEDGEEIALVTEHVRTVSHASGSGYARRFASSSGAGLVLAPSADPEAARVLGSAVLGPPDRGQRGPWTHVDVFDLGDGQVLVRTEVRPSRASARFAAAGRAVLYASAWNREVARELLASTVGGHRLEQILAELGLAEEEGR